MSRRNNFNNVSRKLNYTLIDGIKDKIYTMGLGKYQYDKALDLCQSGLQQFKAWHRDPYRGDLLRSENSNKERIKIVSKYFSSHLPFWVQMETKSISENDLCSAVNTVKLHLTALCFLSVTFFM